MSELTQKERERLTEEVRILGEQIRELKTNKADEALIKEKVAEMLTKKKALGIEDASGKFQLKCPKGTRDYGPRAMAIRERVLNTVTAAFKRHGAETIDTPVFELRDVLLGKYGEEGGKLVFDLQDQGGELLSLRYDLTVPFARYLAMNKVNNLKRYQIAKVYRRDQPVMTRGRYREFYQCDFDIAGQYAEMMPEAECLRIVDEILSEIKIGEYFTKLNHRLLLDGMFTAAGVDAKQFKTVCSSVDKLDKVSWEEIEKELVDEKKIPVGVVKKLETFVRLRDNNVGLSNVELLDLVEKTDGLASNANSMKAVKELRTLLEFLELYGVTDRVVFDPSLARGLDYYTGVIYETVVKGIVLGEGEEAGGVGSIAAGGRYDNLVSMFGGKKLQVPCCGVSLGIERIFAVVDAQTQNQNVRTSETEVYVASAQNGLLKERMKLCKLLWDAAIKANPKMLNQLQDCEAHLIPLAVIIGEDELRKGVVKIRDIPTREEKEVSLSDLVNEIRKMLATKK